VTVSGALSSRGGEGIVNFKIRHLKGLRRGRPVTSTSRRNSGIINVEIEKGRDIDFIGSWK